MFCFGVGAPNIAGVLTGSAETGRIGGLGQPAFVFDNHTGSLLYRPHTDLAGPASTPGPHTVICLTVSGGADIKAIAVVLAQIFQDIGAGKQGLCF